MNVLDRAIAWFAPQRAVARLAARASLEQIEKLIGSQAGYSAGQVNRLRPMIRVIRDENRIPRDQVEQLRQRSWDSYRNQPHLRGAVNKLASKVLPLLPQPQAITRDGEDFAAFNRRALELWNRAAARLDYRGAPHRGGQTWREMSRTVFRCCFLDGEVLYALRDVRPDSDGSDVPLRIQPIKANRLAEDVTDERRRVFRGIELDGQLRRQAYWIRSIDPATGLESEPRRYDASRIGHLFVQDDIDQLRGSAWAAAVLATATDTGEYQYNELVASKFGACPVMGVVRPTGATRFGVQATAAGDLVDEEGNPITAVSPGMIVDLGPDGDLKAWNSMRPNSGAESWIQHLLRSIGVGIPGTKSSTLTGDYRRSSFSAERSADNDTWPEIEDLQAWFAAGFCQPIWEAFLLSAVLAGHFEGIVSEGEFALGREALVRCDWQGPVQQSINPVDDANASILEVGSGTSSVPRECRKRGIDWRANLAEQAEFLAEARRLGVPLSPAGAAAQSAGDEASQEEDEASPVGSEA